MRIRNQAQEVVFETESMRDNRFSVETKTGSFQIIVGVDTGDLYITAFTKSQIAVLPCGDYKCIRIAQRSE